MRSRSRDPRTQPVPSMAAWVDGSASTANTASGTASIVVDTLTRSVSMPVRRLGGPELIAAQARRATAPSTPVTARAAAHLWASSEVPVVTDESATPAESYGHGQGADSHVHVAGRVRRPARRQPSGVVRLVLERRRRGAKRAGGHELLG